MKDKRIEWIDVAKAIGIIIVLAYHACPDGYFKNMMWQMHMPLFAFLSGIVYKEEYSLNFQKVRIFIVKKIEKLYIPFEAYSLFFLLLHNFFYKINFIGEINGNKILWGGVRKTIRFDSYIRWWRITDRSVMVSDSAI